MSLSRLHRPLSALRMVAAVALSLAASAPALLAVSGVAAAEGDCADFALKQPFELDGQAVIDACNANDPSEAIQLARAALYANAFDSAETYLRTVAQSQSAEAIYFLGQVAEEGLAGKPDPSDAFFSYRDAADSGFKPAEIAFARVALRGDRARQKPEAIKVLRAAVEANQIAAAAPLARALFAGNGVTRNWIEANATASLGETGGDPESLYLIGTWHRDGTAAQKDLASAIDYINEAAELGHVEALFVRGQLRLRDGIPRRWADPQAALDDMMRAYVRTGSPGARERLFNLFRKLPQRATRMDIQRFLNDAGLDTGGVDGALGKKSRAALEAYRAQQVRWPAEAAQ